MKVKIILFFALVLLLALSGCSQTNSQSQVAASATDTSQSTKEVKPTNSPAIEATSVAVDNCVSCHSDKEMLIKTAKLEEEQVAENEGVG